MNVVSKILIVVNLLLAVVFLGSAAVFLGARENWKLDYETLKAKSEQETADLREQLSRESGLRAQAVTEANAARQANVDLSGRLEQAEEGYAKISEISNDLRADYERMSQTVADLESQIEARAQEIARLTQEKEAADAARRQALTERNDAVAEKHRLESRIQDDDTQMADFRKQITAMSDQIESLELNLAAYQRLYPAPGTPMPRLTAKVLGANEDLNLVMISIGRDDGVKEGYSFEVYRDNQYVGKIVIDRVEKDYAAGYSLKPLQKMPIEVGDTATTIL